MGAGHVDSGGEGSAAASTAAAPDPLLAAVGNRIRSARLAAGIGPVEAARRMDVKKGYWNRLERGLQNVSLRTLARVAAALGTTMAALVEDVALEGAGLDTRGYAWKAGKDVRQTTWREAPPPSDTSSGPGSDPRQEA